MPKGYGQYCGFARALEVVGERWALLVVRDLVSAPKRFSDLQKGLSGIPSNVLTKRLKDLEAAGVVHRRLLAPPDRSVVYDLTPYGRELEEIVIGLGRWGAKSLKEPRRGEIVTPDSLLSALQSTFRPESARGVAVCYELRAGEIVLHAEISDGELRTALGPAPNPDLVVEAGPAMRAVMAGEIAPADAIAGGNIRVAGDAALLDLFARLFRIDPLPATR